MLEAYTPPRMFTHGCRNVETPACLLVCRTASTFARLADALGYVPKEDIFHALKAIVATQRDYGRRDDRKYSRLKYLVHEWGLPKFRSVVEQYYGKQMQPFR